MLPSIKPMEEKQDSLKRQVLKSLFWLASLKSLGQAISWGITIFVVRILNPDDYGLMAKAYVWIGFLTMISEFGLAGAVVQVKSVSELQLRQVFGLALLSNLGMFCIMFFAAPAIAQFFHDARLIPIFRILSMLFILMSFYVIPQALLTKEMDFREKSMVDLAASLASSILTLYLALQEFGVWSLVWGVVANSAVLLVGYNGIKRVIRLPTFNFTNFRHFISFGGFLTISRILWYIYSQVDLFIGGRVLPGNLLGVYSVALNLSATPMDKVAPVLNQVAFPAYSKIQNQPDTISRQFLKSVRLVSLVGFPIFWGLLVVAGDLIPLLLGKKWVEVVLPFQILCIIMPFRLIGTLFATVLQGIGKAKAAFMNVAVAFVVMVAAFLLGIRWGIIGLCLAWVGGYFLAFVIMSKQVLAVLGVSVRTFAAQIGTPFFSGLFMLAVLLIRQASGQVFGPALILTLSIFLGGFIFIASAWLMDKKVFSEVFLLLKKNEAGT